MAFGGFDSGGDQKPMAEINMVPLIDVMLVLLVIFIITAPLLTHSVKIDLPKASSNPNITKPEHVQIGIRQDGRLFWNGEQAEKADLQKRMSQAATLGHVHGGQGGAEEDRFCHRSLWRRLTRPTALPRHDLAMMSRMNRLPTAEIHQQCDQPQQDRSVGVRADLFSTLIPAV